MKEMKESNLAAAIEKAANQRAQEVIKNIKESVVESVKKHWRPKAAGEEFVGDDIRHVLKTLAEVDEWKRVKLPVSPKLVNACRGAIINELLNGLPKLQELSAMADEFSDQSERDEGYES